jgi:hypothetical protein
VSSAATFNPGDRFVVVIGSESVTVTLIRYSITYSGWVVHRSDFPTHESFFTDTFLVLISPRIRRIEPAFKPKAGDRFQNTRTDVVWVLRARVGSLGLGAYSGPQEQWKADREDLPDARLVVLTSDLHDRQLYRRLQPETQVNVGDRFRSSGGNIWTVVGAMLEGFWKVRSDLTPLLENHVKTNWLLDECIRLPPISQSAPTPPAKSKEEIDNELADAEYEALRQQVNEDTGSRSAIVIKDRMLAPIAETTFLLRRKT